MKIKNIIIPIVTVFLILSLVITTQNQTLAAKSRQPIIRVLIIKEASSILLSVKGPYKIINLKNDKLLNEGKILGSKKTIASETGIRIKKKDFLNASALKIIPERDGSIYVNGRRFRGVVFIVRNNNKTINVINELDLEDYICGVLYHEISQKWPLETIKAQAIASRTFALYQIKVSKDKNYDVTADIYSQVYGGATSEKGRTTKGVEMTKGQVLAYEGDIFPAYFHATCAGHTEDASQLWKIDLPPLKGVPCEFCQDSPHYKWEKVITFSELRDMLKGAGKPVKEIMSLDIIERNASGRVSKISIKTDSDEIIISGKEFRMLAGPNIIRSTNFTTQTLFGMVQFTGLGWGHGVGLCQWGAYGLAKNGYDLKAIINRYYPQAELTTVNEVK